MREEELYYVIYVGAGKESIAETYIRKAVEESGAGSCSTVMRMAEDIAGAEGAGEEISADQVSDQNELCMACFHPVRHMRKKIRGKWTDYYERLIPGYVFVESGDILELYKELRKWPVFLKVLGKEVQEEEVILFHALPENEVDWLQKMMGNFDGEADAEIGKEPVVELSQVGFDENDQVVIVDGPLKNMTGLIKKINLHKRNAEVEIELLGRKISIYLGIELLGDRKTNA